MMAARRPGYSGQPSGLGPLSNPGKAPALPGNFYLGSAEHDRWMGDVPRGVDPRGR